MEYKSDKMMRGEDKGNPMEKVLAETRCSEIDEKDGQKNFTRSLGDDAEKKIGDWKGGEKVGEKEASGEVNMEASITADDVIRAGGFGARDDISSFLPVASDSTDFEASIRDARDYEAPQGEVSRPGLGWTPPTTSKGE
ncbi:uncharacterized protein G2W53_024515 [Senna tora]|uniref:Uncharacterized protein n=1 Tax=Senna tora TaxID=362788 RepID=A0A834TC65_9FABA|nr:uncharacterized protein G2W53_024515 [Senna tora]